MNCILEEFTSTFGKKEIISRSFVSMDKSKAFVATGTPEQVNSTGAGVGVGVGVVAYIAVYVKNGNANVCNLCVIVFYL